MAHTTLVRQPYQKNDKKYDHNAIIKKKITTSRSTKSSLITSKASPTRAPDQLTMHDIINASLLKSTCHKIFVLSDTLERILY